MEAELMKTKDELLILMCDEIYLRLRILMESTLVGIILSTIGQFPVVHIVLAATVALNDATDDEKEEKENKGEDHADEPASGGDAAFTWWHHHHI
jgi:hypothetical protein